MNYRRKLLKTTLVFFKIFLDFRKELKLYRKLGYGPTQQRMATAHTRRATELYDIAVESGGVFIKLCQFLSSRRDIFPEPYITILSPLQDKVPPVAFSELEPVLTNALDNYKTVFRSVDPIPLAFAWFAVKGHISSKSFPLFILLLSIAASWAAFSIGGGFSVLFLAHINIFFEFLFNNYELL